MRHMNFDVFGASCGRIVRLVRFPLLPVLTGLALAGCSADVIRLDSPASFSLTESSSPMNRPSASMSRSSAGMGSLQPSSNESYTAPAPLSGSGVKMAALPEPAPAAGNVASSPSSAGKATKPAGVPPAVTEPVSALPASDKGEAIQVKAGDTLFGLSKRYHASVAELMSVNGLSSPNLKPGQTLYLPVGKNANKRPLTRTGQVAVAPSSGSPVAQPLTPPSAAVVAKYDGAYTVKKGDSLYALALQLKVPMTELQQVNGIADVRKVRPGTLLKVPSSSPLAQVPDTTAPASVAAGVADTAKVPQAIAQAEAARTVPPTAQPVVINARKVAAIDMAKADTPPGEAAGVTPPADKSAQAASGGSAAGAAIGKLRWPAKGKIIGQFGPRPDGTHNDGVNLSVPLGTDVHAAESGVVAYAGSELKGYGNLILVRHDNGWITAYAHNEELLAKRGDKVKRGQVLAKAGKTGQVDQPQVHFELRQGSKPVDPTPFMEKL